MKVITSNSVEQLLHLLRVNGLHFSSRSKEDTEDIKKYVLGVSHKFSEF